MNGVIVSNGFGQFHLRGLAENLDSAGELRLFISGALPPVWLRRIPQSGIGGSVGRWIERDVKVAPGRRRSIWSAEVPHQVAQKLRARGHVADADRLYARSLDRYTAGAARLLKRCDVREAVYHYRAGFGGHSLAVARSLGMALVCDHSIAAPGVIDRYVPQAPPTKLMPLLWARIRRDIEAADRILVNSDFVAETMVESGVSRDLLSVAYTPVDESFVESADACEISRNAVPVVTYAGTAEYRKGIDTVIETILESNDDRIRWRIVGDWAVDARHLRDKLPAHVELLPKVPRAHLASILSESDVFFFPTRAEGSARVVAEALIAGCKIVTTHMAGSALRAGIDGEVLPDPDDVGAFRRAIAMIVGTPAHVRARDREDTKRYARERLSAGRYLRDVQTAYRSVR